MRDDKIPFLTRLVSAAVVPFLWLAFLILYFYPDQTGMRFAWAIKPHMTSLYLGAGYLGGSWLFLNAIFGKRWHRVQAGFPAVTTFTWSMQIATFLHWDRFAHGRLGFTLWLILYIVTPLLVPAVWLINRRRDPCKPEDSDLNVPVMVRWVMRLSGMAALLFAAAGFLFPAFLIRIWPWTLTPLTTRVMAGWLALLGVGSLAMAGDSRWSTWRVPMASILIWHLLVLLAAALNPPDFKTGVLNWYTVSIAITMAGTMVYYFYMEGRRWRRNRQPVPSLEERQQGTFPRPRGFSPGRSGMPPASGID